MHARHVIEDLLGLIGEVQIEESPEVAIQHWWIDAIYRYLKINLSACDGPQVFLAVVEFCLLK